MSTSGTETDGAAKTGRKFPWTVYLIVLFPILAVTAAPGRSFSAWRGRFLPVPSRPAAISNYMKVNDLKKNSVLGKMMTDKSARSILAAVVLSGIGLGLNGCVEPYPYRSGGVVYSSPGYVAVEVGDRPYYTRGAGYYVGRSYYVWRPGHWRYRHGQRIWIHGHYVLRG